MCVYNNIANVVESSDPWSHWVHWRGSTSQERRLVTASVSTVFCLSCPLLHRTTAGTPSLWGWLWSIVLPGLTLPSLPPTLLHHMLRHNVVCCLVIVTMTGEISPLVAAWSRLTRPLGRTREPGRSPWQCGQTSWCCLSCDWANYPLTRVEGWNGRLDGPIAKRARHWVSLHHLSSELLRARYNRPLIWLHLNEYEIYIYVYVCMYERLKD